MDHADEKDRTRAFLIMAADQLQRLAEAGQRASADTLRYLANQCAAQADRLNEAGQQPSLPAASGQPPTPKKIPVRSVKAQVPLYRRDAATLRDIAEHERPGRLRQELLAIAAHYEQLAINLSQGC